MATDFCPRCYAKVKARLINSGFGARAVLDGRRMAFPCKIPIHTHDNLGRPMVRFYSCKTNTVKEILLEEWKRKKASGEL